MPTGNQSSTPQLKSADQTSRSLRSGRCTWTAAGYTETQHNTPPRARQKLAGFYSCRISPDPAASASTCEFGRRGRQPRPGRPVCHAMCRRAGCMHARATRGNSTVNHLKAEAGGGKSGSRFSNFHGFPLASSRALIPQPATSTIQKKEKTRTSSFSGFQPILAQVTELLPSNKPHN